MSTRWISIALSGLMTTSLLTVSLLAAQQTKPATGHDMPMGQMKDSMAGSPMTKAQKIANAMAAAPSSVSSAATVLDWPAKEGATPEVLRAGTNGWTCFPDMPDTKGNDPMCLDAAWMKFMEAYLAHKTPDVHEAGVGYMIAPGGGWGSNSDPYAMKEAADNHWSLHKPHMMLLVPDVKSLASMSTDPNNGGPYVMWAGTPYAHVMAPTTSAGMKMPEKK